MVSAGGPIVGGRKFVFVGGKGGVGKTVIAAALALDASQHGERVLLASLNPVHSLSSLFDQDFSGGTVKPVKGAQGLDAIEVEIEDIVNQYKSKITARLREFFKWAEVPINPEPFIEVATTNPAFHESAMFDRVMDIVLEMGGKYDLVVFDTAAVANAVRLIGLSKLYGLWLARMIQSRREAMEYRLKLSFRKEKVMEEIKRDPVIADLLSLNEKFTKTREIITNPELTGFYFVTTPESLPISVVVRFIKMVESFNIPVGGVFVNNVIDASDASTDPSGYLAAKMEEQRGYLRTIEEKLGRLVIGYVRSFPSEVRGLEALRDVIGDLRSYTPPIPA
jgi:arsenite-transporting ATPase